MGYHTAEGDPDLLEVREDVHAARPHVRADRLVDAAGAPVPRLGLVGHVLRPRRSDVVLVGPEVPGRHLRRRALEDLGAEDGGAAPVRVGADHVAPLQGGRELGLLRGRGHVRRTAVRAPRRHPHRARAEPAAGVHGDRRHGPARQHPAQRGVRSATPATATCRACRGSCPRQDKGEHPPDSIEVGSGLRRQGDQRRDGGSRGAMAAHGDLPDVGRLGRLLRPRASRRSSTRTGGACGCPRW